MADGTSGQRLIVAAAVMIIVGQLFAIGNDLYLRQRDPSDVILLGVLIVLTVFLVRRARWARWTVVVLVTAGGILGLAGFVLLVALRIAPGSWSAIASAVPALASLHSAVNAFTGSRAFPLLAGSVLVSALFDLIAAGVLAFAPSVRAYFAPSAPTLGE